MARTAQKRNKPSNDTSQINIVVNDHLVPLSPFYLFFRREIMKYGRKLNDDEIDHILQVDIPDTSSNVDPSRYYFFGICEQVKRDWEREQPQESFENDYEKLLEHYNRVGKKMKLEDRHNRTSESIESDQIVLSGEKCGLKLVYDEYLNVCEFLDSSSMVNLACVSTTFNSHFKKLVSSLLTCRQLVGYFRKKGIEPRLSLFLTDCLSPELQQFKDSLQIKLLIDFKSLDRQPGGNYDCFIIRQLVLLSSKHTKILQSRIRNYDDTIYENDVIVPVQRDSNQLNDMIRSICKVLLEHKKSHPLIFKPELTQQFIFTSKDDTNYSDDPIDWSQIEICLHDGCEKFFDFVKVSVPLDEFNMVPFDESKSSLNIIENAFSFCKVSTNLEDEHTEIESLAQTCNIFTKGPNYEEQQTTTKEDDDEDNEEDEDNDSQIDLERENEKMWTQFFNRQ